MTLITIRPRRRAARACPIAWLTCVWCKVRFSAQGKGEAFTMCAACIRHLDELGELAPRDGAAPTAAEARPCTP